MGSTTVARHRDDLVEAWFERLVSGYPEQTARFLRERTDPFHNPVGTGLRRELAVVVDGLVKDAAPDEMAEALDRMVRIRAVQDMPPSAAVGFVLDLKMLVRQQVGPEIDPAELERLDGWVDRLMLAAFDVYAECREQVSEIRVHEIRNRSMKVMERLNAWRERRDAARADEAPAT